MTTVTRKEGGSDVRYLQMKLMTDSRATETFTCGGSIKSHYHKLYLFFYFRVFKKASPNGKVSVKSVTRPASLLVDVKQHN